LAVATDRDGTSTPPRRASPRPAAPLALAMPALPLAPRPAFTPHAPVLLTRKPDEARWAPVLRDVVARRAPRQDAGTVATLLPRTPEGTTNIVAVVRETDRNGTIWTLVKLPVLPNGSVGWVPRLALGGYGFTTTRLVVDREDFVATLYRDG